MPAEPPSLTEDQRAAALLDAQQKAAALFDAIERGGLLRPGVSEAALSREIHALGAGALAALGGSSSGGIVQAHWHKRVVRSGPHTLLPYQENPPDRTLAPGDILFVDLGPVFEGAWEADFGRTFVLPPPAPAPSSFSSSEQEKDAQDDDFQAKCRLRDALAPAWAACRDAYRARPDGAMTGGELYARAQEAARSAGYEFGGAHAGHLVGHFPHERIPNDMVTFYITSGNDLPMGRLDGNGKKYHWILEMHLVDRERQIGGFMEELLTVG